MADSDAVVFIVDDDAAIRESLVDLLQSVGLRAEAFSSAQAFLRARRDDLPSCLVLDVRLKGLSGLDLQKEMAESDVQLPIIFITAHGDVPMSVKAIKGGAVEFLTKPFREQDLLDAVGDALKRDRNRRDERANLESLNSRYRSLTARERQVMSHVTAGLLNKQIAGELEISEAAVKVHRQHVMEKMAAGSLAELVRMADKLNTPARK